VNVLFSIYYVNGKDFFLMMFYAQITGAGHGIGRELALQFSSLGARLALWDLDLGLCEQTAKEVRSLGGQAQAFCCDVSNRQQVLETAEKTRKQVS
jgi:all-trans-retinol dehydrogenase (NAD+)